MKENLLATRKPHLPGGFSASRHNKPVQRYSVELETEVCEDFTVTEKAPTRVALRIYANKIAHLL